MALELTAVVFALLYLALAIRESRICWIAAAVSAALYTWIFAAASLYMEAWLQLFYIGMAVVGWLSWGRDGSEDQLPIQRWPLGYHLTALGTTLLISLLSGFLLAQYTNAALPFLDSFTTVGGVITTWMVARKVLENWLYWIVIDLISIYVYTARSLDLTAVLFGGYVLLAVAGFLEWRRHYLKS